MADSRRINTNIREEESRGAGAGAVPVAQEGAELTTPLPPPPTSPPLALSAMIFSSEFWPQLKEEKLELPPLVSQAMEAYTHRYEKLKVN